jgi:hypothetical protein
MARSNPELWRRLAEFEVSPPGAVFSFTKRLARENQWSLEFAQRVFEEYRRFLYLCAVAGRQLTPSPAVDLIWQLHLGYPGSYGQDLCAGVLRRPLSCRQPEVGAVERSRPGDHQATLAAYQREFGCAPPAEIWPTAERRPELPGADRPGRAARKARGLPAAPLMPAAGPA